MSVAQEPVGTMLRDWRTRRRLSQLDLALEADVSTRHLSFVETGRAHPSREMILKLAERMDIPLREQNTLLLAGGFAPLYREQSLESPSLARARDAVQRILTGHEPYPAIAIDRHWNLLAFNEAIGPLLAGIAPDLLQPPVNVLRLSLHPDGLAPRIVNLAEWRAHLLDRLDRQIELTADPELNALWQELAGYPAEEAEGSGHIDALVVPLVLRTAAGALRLFSTTTVFGTPLEITLSELTIESFFPADAETARILHDLASSKG
jgi:transcriptional regulator with XRE-family HTH domain